MLITLLEQHSVILRKSWLNWHKVVFNIKFNHLIFVLSQGSHFEASKTSENQKSELFKKLHTNDSSKEDVSVSKIIKILRQLLNTNTNLNWTEKPNLRELSMIVKFREFSIVMIRAAAFKTAAHQKKTQLFSITMSELDKQLTELRDIAHLSEISEMTEDKWKNLRIKISKKFHNFLNIFDRKATEVLLQTEPMITRSRLTQINSYHKADCTQYHSLSWRR